ncbi:paraquat-inducible protein A [Microbulbifer sp. TYP-18]|uniref:paraquat-inducible protein A n=1 Tax=Microbulbifer sp. TYP-18 TaxID=3230024 RepID=UPI0034C5CCBA
MGPTAIDHRVRDPNRKRACHECDLLLDKGIAPPGDKLSCPRCGATIHRNPSHSVHYTAALSITGLVLFVPAVSLPLLHFSILALGAENTLFNGVHSLLGAGFVWLASLVLFCSVLAPLGKFLLLTFVSIGCHFRTLDGPVTGAVRWYQHLKDWGMLDVYLLGLLVALVKMEDLGKLVVEPGFYCFCALMVVSNLSMLAFDQQSIWNRMERRRRVALPAAEGGEVG